MLNIEYSSQPTVIELDLAETNFGERAVIIQNRARLLHRCSTTESREIVCLYI